MGLLLAFFFFFLACGHCWLGFNVSASSTDWSIQVDQPPTLSRIMGFP